MAGYPIRSSGGPDRRWQRASTQNTRATTRYAAGPRQRRMALGGAATPHRELHRHGRLSTWHPTPPPDAAPPPAPTMLGRVTFVSPTLDEKTRTAKVRLDLDNAGGLLRPDMYAEVILQEPVGMAVAVPDSAVLQTGTRSIAFVDRGNGQFEPREVRTGVKANGYYEIKSGISAGETVAVDANFLIDSESRLKAALSGMKQ